MISVFDYLDYRTFLKDWYEEKKKSQPGFSYRVLARGVGFNASTFTRLISGARNMVPALAAKLALAMKLPKKDAEYFQLLVLYCQAGTHQERALFFEQLMEYWDAKTTIFSRDEYELFNRWHNLALLQLLYYYPFNPDASKDGYAGLSRMLAPPISVSECKKSIALLEQMHLIVRGSDGCYVWPAETARSTGPGADSPALTNFHLATMELARESIERFNSDQRHIATLTLCLSRGGYDRAVDALRNVRVHLLQLAKNDTDEERVYHINFQMFPMTLPKPEGEV